MAVGCIWLLLLVVRAFLVVGASAFGIYTWAEEEFQFGKLVYSGVNCCVYISIGPDIRQDYPLNLSILISGGKETNQDSPSNGE